MNSTTKEEAIEAFKRDIYLLAERQENVPLAVALEGAVTPDNVLQALAELVRSGTPSNSVFAFGDATKQSEESKEAERLAWLYAEFLGVDLIVDQPGFAHLMRYEPTPEIDTVFS